MNTLTKALNQLGFLGRLAVFHRIGDCVTEVYYDSTKITELTSYEVLRDCYATVDHVVLGVYKLDRDWKRTMEVQ